ncbi:hypothetical protein [Parasphingopyxis lamellibrachiae]|uniref:Uncharacterized protein n=1 Tax=Parasphingopyxis lamellibrachiae TaxID=680125 RepID=A0A3D9FIP3_9SPHN|nr:hypothetical protein [Parasphingopyxis lamellibrachiae]RED17659.1 hypothetical protein DFR46_2710 [Parasphingopyxis lamellibrachiae]
MKKLVYTMLVALVGTPPAMAQSDGVAEETEQAVEAQAVPDFDKPEEASEPRPMLSEEEAAENDAAKARLEAAGEEVAPGEKPE